MVKLIMRYKICLFLVLFLMPLSVRASQVSLMAQVDRSEVKLGDTLQLKVTANGVRNISQPQIRKTKDFNLRYHGSSSQFRMVNGTSTSSVVFTYTVFPAKQGQFTIGPLYVDYKGKKLTSNSIKVRVLPQDAEVKESTPVFLQAKISNPSPYYNQQIIYTLQFFRHLDVMNARLEMPSFEGFWSEKLGDQADFQRVIEGRSYMVTELKMALFPNKTGKLTIEPATIECDVVLPRRRSGRRARNPFFDEFFSDSILSLRRRTEHKVFHPLPLVVDVKSLPEKGKPAKFHPLVGKVEIGSKISKKKLETGDSSTLTVTIFGDANIRDADLTETELSDNFKVYDDKPTVEFAPQGGRLLGKKIFKKAFVPLKPGEREVPVFKVHYFNPQKKRYEVAQTRPQTLSVKASAEKEKLNVLSLFTGVIPKKEIKILGKDILSIYTQTEALTAADLSGFEQVIYLLVFLLPSGGFMGVLAVRKRSRLYLRNASIVRKKKAFKSADKKLKKVSGLTSNSSEFYPQISKVIKEYLGDKLDLTGGALTPQEIQNKLEVLGVEKEQIVKMNELMEQCEYCQFASSDKSSDNCQQVLINTEKLLAQMEKHF